MSPTEPEREKLVKVTTVANEAEATMLSGLLMENGIPSVARPAGAGPGIFSPAGLPHHIYVLASHVPRAKELIEAYLSPDESSSSTEDEDRDDGNASSGSV